MIPSIKKILYATDLSVNSEYAFSYAVNSARKHNAEIILLHVIETPSQNVLAMIAGYPTQDNWVQKNKEIAIETTETQLREFIKREFSDDPNGGVPISEIIVEEGYPAEIILKKADEFKCDIIIMGSHGKGVITHAFLGSVAERVLRRVRKPVFIIPLPAE